MDHRSAGRTMLYRAASKAAKRAFPRLIRFVDFPYECRRPCNRPRRRKGNKALVMDWQFWDNKDAWPIDHPDYIFLARAFHQIGRAKFGADWDYEPPDPPDPSNEVLSDEWETLADAAEAKTEQMYAAVQRTISEQCLLGVLGTAARPLSGGACIPLTRDDWNSENCERRFERCQIAMRNRFGSDGFAVLDHWLFIERSTLQRYIAALTNSAERPNLEAATAEAINQKWPSGIPSGLKAAERDEQLRNFMFAQEMSKPSPAVIRRALRRVRSERV